MALRQEDIQKYLSDNKLGFNPNDIQTGLAQYNTANPNAQYSLADLGQAYGQNRAQTADWMNAGKPQTFSGLFGDQAYTQRPDAQGFMVIDKPTDENMNAYNQQFMVNGQDMRHAWEGQSAVKTDEGSGFPQFMANGQPPAARSYLDLPSQSENGPERRYIDETLDDPHAWTYDARNGEYVSPDGKRVSIAGLGYNDPTTASFEVGRLASKEGKNIDSWSAYGPQKSDEHYGTNATEYRGALMNDLKKITDYDNDGGLAGDIMGAALDYGPQLILAAATMGAGGLGSFLPSSMGDLGMSLGKNAIGQLVTTGTVDPTRLAMSALPGSSGITNQITESIGGGLPDVGLNDLGQAGDVLNDAAGSVIKGSTSNLLSGRDPFANIGSNALSGTVNSATSNYLPSTGDATTDEIIRNATRVGANAAIGGKNIVNAVGSNLANTGANTMLKGGLNAVRRARGGPIRRFEDGGEVDYNDGTDFVFGGLTEDPGFDYTGTGETGSNIDPSFYLDGNGGSQNVEGVWQPNGPTMEELAIQGNAQSDQFNSDPNNANEYDKLVQSWYDQYAPTSAGYGLPTSAPKTAAPKTGGGDGKSILDKTMGFLGDKGNAAAILALLNSLKGGTKPFTQSPTALRPASLLDQPLPKLTPQPLAVNAYQGDFTKYGQPGQGGEHQFIKAACGGHLAGGGGLGSMLERYVEGGSSGQADDVPAMLSHGEYVIDADTVSALGDGNNSAGAKALDAFIRKVRAHKRSAPVSKIPPKAKAPQQYMKKGK